MNPRETLLALLPSDREADAACAAALKDQSARIAWHDQHLADCTKLAYIYERRAEHLATNQVRDLGAVDFPRLVRESGHEQVALASVHSPSWNFVLALSPSRQTVLATMAVDASVASRDWDWDASHPD